MIGATVFAPLSSDPHPITWALSSFGPDWAPSLIGAVILLAVISLVRYAARSRRSAHCSCCSHSGSSDGHSGWWFGGNHQHQPGCPLAQDQQGGSSDSDGSDYTPSDVGPSDSGGGDSGGDGGGGGGGGGGGD